MYNRTNKPSRLNMALIIALVMTILTTAIGNFTAFASDCGVIRENTLRLHIIANSDSDGDQNLKLLVRDKILENSAQLFAQEDTFNNAKAQVERQIEQINALASETVRENGYSYAVNVEVCNMYFNTRSYDATTLPAGNYDALRITIGNADGKNWWCVLYPSLCIPAASKIKNSQMGNLSSEQQDIMANRDKYEVRFATVELFERIKAMFK